MGKLQDGSTSFRIAAHWRDRVHGLLGTHASERVLMLVPCHSVHTFGMRYALDIAFIGADGCVLRACRSVPPGRIVSCRRAVAVLERAYSLRHGWYRKGDVVELGRKVGLQ